MSVVAGILSAIGALITAVGSIWIGYTKTRTETQSLKGSRIDAMETRIDKMQSDLDVEREKRRRVELDNHQLHIALVTTVTHLEQLIRWADGGAKPPRPDDIDLDEIKALLRI